MTEERALRGFGHVESGQIGSLSYSDADVDYLENNHSAKIIEYCPAIFRDLRYNDGITTEVINE